jgi:hypothetical protein
VIINNCHVGHFGQPKYISHSWSTEIYTDTLLSNGKRAVIPVDVPPMQLSEYFVDQFDSFVQTVPAEQPIFAFLFLNEVHRPVIASPELEQECMNGTICKRSYQTVTDVVDYYGCVVAIDRAVGRVQDILEKAERLNDTLLIFTSDNGPEDDDDGTSIGSSAPFIGWKGSVQEGSFRIPGLFSWPRMIASNFVVKAVASSLDSYQTFLDIFAMENSSFVPIVSREILDGTSLLPLIQSPRNWTRPIPFGMCKPKLFSPLASTCSSYAYISGRWKLVVDRKKQISKLYDLETDPREEIDLSKANLPISLQLTSGGNSWLQRVLGDYMKYCIYH